MVLERFRVTDRVAVVTGGGRGIGRGVALALAEAGADVVVAARREETLDEVVAAVEALGRRGLAVPTDVTDPAQREALVARTVDTFGRLDILINNAGGTMPGPALMLDETNFVEAFRFNVVQALHMARLCAAPMMKSGGGAIVSTSSAIGHLVDAGFVAYGTCKAALDHMTRLLAYEWAPDIRVNAIAVGATRTDALEMVTQNEDILRQVVERTPMGRLGTVEDIAACALWLASPAGSWVTGKVVEVDGGTETSSWPFKMPSGLDAL